LTVDFVLAYPQADVESEIYMKIPRGIDFGPNISRLSNFLKLVKNIYSLNKQDVCGINPYTKVSQA